MANLKKLLSERLMKYEKIISRLDLSQEKKEQIGISFINYVRLLENLAKRHLLAQDISNITVIVLSAIVPLLINYSNGEDGAEIGNNVLLLATIFSVILAILNALRQSYKFREKWQSYRKTVELLILEGQSYFSLSGRYSAFGDHDTAFTSFIASINSLRLNQINEYVEKLAPESDQLIQETIEKKVKSRMVEINERKDQIAVKQLINAEINEYVKGLPEIAYFEIDHSRKLISFFTNVQGFTGADKFQFQSASLSEYAFKCEYSFSEVSVHSVFGASAAIRNLDLDSGFGSVGCICMRSDNTPVAVTCYHVVKHPEQDWDGFIPGAHDDVGDLENNKIGTIVEALKSDEYDIAILALDKKLPFEEVLPGPLIIGEPPYIDEENMEDYRNVYIISRSRKFKKIRGRLAEVNKCITLNYGTPANKDLKDLSGLFIIHFVSTEPFSKGGDSGSLVFAADGTAIGILVGGDESRASFAMPFLSVLDYFNLKLY